MGEIINKVNCPNGCQNPIFTESTRLVPENNGNLLNESFQSTGARSKKIKVYNCGCCGSTFELYQNQNNNLLI